jgi:hypothetical protein
LNDDLKDVADPHLPDGHLNADVEVVLLRLLAWRVAVQGKKGVNCEKNHNDWSVAALGCCSQTGEGDADVLDLLNDHGVSELRVRL